MLLRGVWWTLPPHNGTAALWGFKTIRLSSPEAGKNPNCPWPTLSVLAPSSFGPFKPLTLHTAALLLPPGLAASLGPLGREEPKHGDPSGVAGHLKKDRVAL